MTYTACIVALALTLSLAACTRASGHAGFQAFEAVCAGSHGDRAAAIGQAQAAGWSRLKDNEVPTAGGLAKLIEPLKITNYAAFHRADNDLVLLVGDDPSASQLCVVASKTPFREALTDVRGWLASPHLQTWGPGGEVFAFIKRGDQRLPITDHEDPRTAGAIAKRELATVTVIGGETGSLLVYGVPTREA